MNIDWEFAEAATIGALMIYAVGSALVTLLGRLVGWN